ncbi:MAG: LysR substrate-binding domain-containing protein [Azospirillaceae bacterium]
MPFDLRRLRYFVAIAEAGSLSRAADRLSVAQSALSHHVREMEAEIGTALIRRQPRGIDLTDAGARLVEHARLILKTAASAREELRSMGAVPSGAVAIGLAHTVSWVAGGRLLVALRRALPRVRLRLTEGLSPDVADRLARAELDLVVSYNVPDAALFETLPLLEEEVCLIGRADVVGPAERPIAFAEASRLPLMLPGPRSAMSGMIGEQALLSQLDLRVPLQIDSLTMMTQALEAGLGGIFVSRATVVDALAAGRLVARPIVEPAISRRLMISIALGATADVSLKAVHGHVVAVLHRAVADGRWPGGRWIGAPPPTLDDTS